jgi:hypothetical protein
MLNFKNYFHMRTFYLLFIGLFVFSSVFAQGSEKRYFENNPTLGGDVVIKSANVQVVGNEISKIFEIECLESGVYYLDAWIMVPLTQEGYPEYKIAVNDALSASTFKPQTDNWQSVALTDIKKSAATVRLKQGKNSISVIGKGPEIPNVEFIKLSSSAFKAGISDSKYKAYVEGIKANPVLKPIGADSTRLVTRGTAGEIYTYQLNLPVYYTTRMSFSFSANQSVSISTSQSGSYEHVIELFSASNPASYSWVSYSSGNGSLNVTIPASGTYYLRLRTYRQNSSGLVNLSVNGSSYSNCVVAGTGMVISGSYSTNFYTCKLTNSGDTWLFLEESGTPGKIKAFNDDGGTKSDGYSWALASRIGTSVSVNAGLVSAHSSNSPNFTCDLYLGLQPITSSLQSAFPDLPLDNAFISGPQSSIYNCIGWSVGKTNSWDWPSSTNLTAWDNYYQSYGYTRSGATASNAAIALWMYNGVFTHASVRKNTTIVKPHGFEWESKCGSNVRLMHTKDALNSFNSSTAQYGSIAYYYKPINGTASTISTRSSIVSESYFSQSDLNQIALLKDRIPATFISGFEEKYLAWTNTRNPEIDIYSNPRKYAESEEYNSLLNYCLKYGKVTWPLFIDKLAQGDVFVGNLLEDLTYTGKGELVEGVILSSTIETGKPLLSMYSILVDYSKKLLEQEQANIQKSIQEILTVDKDIFAVDITVINKGIILSLNNEVDVKASVKVYDFWGTSVHEASYNILKGGQSISINAANFRNGIYVVQVTVNGKSISKKVSIQ